MPQLLPGLHQIPQILGPRYLYQYLLVGERSLLIDTGIASSPDAVIAPYMHGIGFDPARLDVILISHADVDHMGGNAAMRRLALHAFLACHHRDADWIGSRERIQAERYGWYRQFQQPGGEPFDYPPEVLAWIADNIGPDVGIDLQLSGDEVFALAPDRPVRILHLPGHSPGHVGVYDAANKAVIVIDAILWRGLLDMQGNIISPPPYFQIQPYLDSIDLVLGLDFEHLYTGHYDPISGPAARQWLEESKAFVGRTTEVVTTILRSSSRPLSLPEVYAAANDALGPYTAFTLELAGPVYAHLQQLVAEGRAARSSVAGFPVWQAA